MIKLLEAAGWYLVRVRGNHRHYRHATKPGTATVAGKPSETLRPMTEKSPAAVVRRSMLIRCGDGCWRAESLSVTR
ncbi:MAG: type II toxin-antitoxin system HicA family toxin [Pseudonocardiaceae bacterium]